MIGKTTLATYLRLPALKKQSDIVKRGEVIGLVGSTGISTGPHLHFEVWREFTPLDPIIYFPEYDSLNLISVQ